MTPDPAPSAPLPAGLGVEISVDGPQLERFVVSGARAVVIQGPWGSGKSTAACLKLLLNALRQPPDPVSKKRRRVTYVVRNTFDELERTTIKTWQKIFPPDRWGRPEGNKPKIHRIRTGDLEWDVWFVALDREEDTAKLLSAELSDVWFNELREIPRRLFKDALDRTNRWPDAIGGCYRPQAIGDSNPAAEDHWISIMSGQRPVPEGIDEEERVLLARPDDWEILVQPAAMLEVRDDAGRVTGYAINPARENRRWTGDKYYLDMLSGATRQQVAERVLNRPGLYRTGKPVWGEFHSELHVAGAPLDPIAGHPIMIGMDFGRTPAAVMGQLVFGRWRILAELVSESMGAREFGRHLKRLLATKFPDHDYAIWGDPAGENREQSDDISPFSMLAAEGLRALRAPSNDPVIRLNAVKELLLGLSDGRPRFIVSPSCVTLRAAMEGGYQYPRRQLAGAGTIYGDTPLKNRYSHIADALQYLVLGGGEGGALLGRIKPGAGRMAGQARVARAKVPGLTGRAWQGREAR